MILRHPHYLFFFDQLPPSPVVFHKPVSLIIAETIEQILLHYCRKFFFRFLKFQMLIERRIFKGIDLLYVRQHFRRDLGHVEDAYHEILRRLMGE